MWDNLDPLVTSIPVKLVGCPSTDPFSEESVTTAATDSTGTTSGLMPDLAEEVGAEDAADADVTLDDEDFFVRLEKMLFFSFPFMFSLFPPVCDLRPEVLLDDDVVVGGEEIVAVVVPEASVTGAAAGEDVEEVAAGFPGRGGIGLSVTSSVAPDGIRISSTKLSGKTPILPFNSPLNHPWSSISLERTFMMSPSRMVSSSSF